ncbi:MAG: bifunctional class I SAM-dependent methyltransferase/glycosyltransferase family 2 protein [Bacteroidia bacterium]|nr:bifunctional class I SAM-dependent methyltransferase/glycosyltransferase family 2 protein [Bacteroidia bacterium]
MIEYFRSAAPTWRKYRRRRSYYWDSITRYIEYYIHSSSSVLEIGCGTGELIGELKAAKRVGIDFCEELISQAKDEYKDVEFHCMSAEEFDLGGVKFDVIVLSNLTGFLTDVQLVFERLHSVCKEDTRIIVTSYNRLWEPIIKFAEFIGIKRKTPQQNWLSVHDMQNLLYLAGFDTYRVNSSTLLPIYIPLVSKFCNRILSHLPILNVLALNRYFFARPVPTISDEEARSRYSVSVLVPARNESGNIRNAIERIPDMGSHTQIIFCEGNSTDDTWATIQKLKEEYPEKDIHILQQKGKGKGDAVRCGYAEATGDILMILDADLTVRPEDLPKFYMAIATGKGEFINGVRLVYPMEDRAMRTLNHLGNHFFSLLFSWILEAPIKDTLCGTKVMTRENWLKLTEGRRFFGDFDPFGDFDMLFGAHKLNLKIVDLPIRYQERVYGDTNISRFSHGWLLLRMSAFAASKIRFR